MPEEPQEPEQVEAEQVPQVFFKLRCIKFSAKEHSDVAQSTQMLDTTHVKEDEVLSALLNVFLA